MPEIQDYFIIGDQFSAALVSKEGSIDWLCLPYFDSASLFGRLLDPAAGFFTIDTTDFSVESSYLENTAIVQRILANDELKVVSKDFMVPKEADNADTNQYLIRKIIALEGKGEVSFSISIKPDYATSTGRAKQTSRGIEFKLESSELLLHIPDDAKLTTEKDSIRITVPVDITTERSLILEHIPRGSTHTAVKEAERITKKYWTDWIAKGTYFDFCKEQLIRSAITLKLMQFSPTGAIVAAPTTSLPEEIGGVRNWDYRYVWIRDATFTLYAFHVLGYKDEAQRFFEYLNAITQKSDNEDFDVSLMYTIHGQAVPNEEQLDHLQGYKQSRPVRIGNEAMQQFQLDVYGALIDAFYVSNKTGISHDTSQHSKHLILKLVGKIRQEWQTADSGIWEVRGQTQQYTYSKVMSWVGADRAYRLRDILGLSKEESAASAELANEIKLWIDEHCYDDSHQNLMQHPGSTTIDATNFLFVLLQYLDKHDDATKTVIAQSQAALSHDEIFINRYNGDDGLPGREGAFILCSFWMISALAILEDTDEALKLFKKLESHIAPHGLISEEIDPVTKEYLGNYPQSFSHLGYIMSAYYLNRYIERNNEQRVGLGLSKPKQLLSEV